ncbi:MAG: tRNA epoxyqueuosine(34) reductase QueG [Bacteroidales bacterium]|jgi:epoxyqueuosine reductase|nr:tRNA epoxyqueuosine(34) reductase QueG [Bacteroidales bacterium]
MTDARKIALTWKIKELLHQEGFDISGIAPAASHHEDAQHISDWIASGKSGTMRFMERNSDKRGDITSLVEGAKSVIVAGIRYYSADLSNSSRNYFISRYARVRDYHQVVEDKLNRVMKFIKKELPETISRAFCDSAPVSEKSWAIRAGLGWRGRNSLLINKDIGSFLFLGEIISTAELIYDNASSRDRCGTCTLCVEACPTGAICADRTINATRCISYLTIEHKGDLPEEFTGKFENMIFGCDRCQEVCPWNGKTFPYSDRELVPDYNIAAITKSEWNAMTADDFKKIFKASAIRRTGYKMIRRNIDFVNSVLPEER